MSSADQRFRSRFAEARRKSGTSLAVLAAATFVSRGWINNVEAGRRWPSREWVEQADRVLGAGYTLVDAWDAAERERGTAAETTALLNDVNRETQLLLASRPDAVDLDQINERVTELSVAYLANPARPMLEQGRLLRHELTRRLISGAIRPGELTDLYVALGRVCGILTYAALDLGSPTTAASHADLAWQMAELAGDGELKAWVRGTQSLLARFEKNFVLATEYVSDGLQYAGPGTSTVRLLSGAAQCAANGGDSQAAIKLIEKARKAREVSGDDSVSGLFTFSPAKLEYYTASSLMWLPDPAALQIAETSAISAIETWAHEPRETRSLDDEALAHVYLATARLKLGEVDGAMEAVHPIINLPEERQISWIRKRIGELGPLLEDDRFGSSPTAADAREMLRAYA